MENRSTSVPSSANAVEIITWFLMVVSVLAYIARISTKWALHRSLNWDDLACTISVVFDLGAGACVTIMVQNGLAKDEESLSNSVFERFEKSLYSLQLLYFGTLCFAKLSIILLLRLISPNIIHQRLGFTLGIFIAIWSFIALIATAFQCEPPNVWQLNDNHCYDRAGFWWAAGVINMLTDIFLIILPLWIVTNLQLNLKKKAVVFCCFGTRGFDLVATICQLIYTKELQLSNITSEIWPWVLCGQIVQTSSIITSCIPYLRPLLDAFPAGMLTNNDITQQSNPSKYLNGYVKRTDHEYILRDVNTSSTKDSENPIFPDLSGRECQNTSHAIYAPDENLLEDGQIYHNREESWDGNHRIIKATTTVETTWQNREDFGQK